MYYWYRLFTYLLYPFAPVYLYIRKIRKKEDPIRYKEKLSKINISRDKGFLIWFHVASVGEAMSILPLIDACIKEQKINKILITSITISSGKILEQKFNKSTNVIHQYLPLDVPILVNKFLEHWKPNLSIFIDSEVWPNLILNIKKVLRVSISKGGSSIKDFKNTLGKSGTFQQFFHVYGKENKNCSRISCKGKIKKIIISNRSSFYCNKCQI